ncbi:matrixin family metalloprotease [Actinomadura yumaensis]|uniref:Matrixin family metalloprotease n=2 Tax=Actinomadura TaxID=1988 RepID=A0ABW2CR18_9ACTN|nr:matrixin family metalloprotease [Actinomadura sp. J1-007]
MVTPAAHADNWGSTACGGEPRNCVSLANNNEHSVFLDGSFGDDVASDVPGLDDAVRWSLANVYTPTDMNAYVDQADPYPDVRMADFDWGVRNGVVGWAQCPDTNTGTGGDRAAGTGWCRGQHLRFNAYYYWHYSGVFDTATQRRQIACHETGHTVGLRHRNTLDSCMYTNAGEGAAATLDAHDRGHINGHY